MSNSSNVKLLAKYSSRMAAGDYDAVFDYFSPDFYSHVTPRVNPSALQDDIRTYEREFWTAARGAFPDMEFKVDLFLEVDDLVVSHWTLTGTHSGEAYYDVPPSGKRVTISGTAILRFRDSQVVEHWGGPHCSQGVGHSAAPSPHA